MIWYNLSAEQRRIIEDAMVVAHKNYRDAGRSSAGMAFAVWVESKILNDLARQQYTVLEYFD